MGISKYENLAQYLAGKDDKKFMITFKKIEEIIDDKLPKAAREHRAWWANSDSNNHAIQGWLRAGWETSRVDMENQVLIFVRKPKAPVGQFQMAMTSVKDYRDQTLTSPVGDLSNTELELILQKTGGQIALNHIIDAVERYIDGELLEAELGQILRKHWPRGK